MPAILGILGPLLPYLLLALVAVAGYFGIKRKGVAEERQRQETAQAEAKTKVEARVHEAVKQDDSVNAKVEAKVEEIEQTAKPVAPSDPDKFRF